MQIRDTKATFHAKMGLIKDRNGMDLTELEDIRKRWLEYREELYKKGLNDLDKHSGAVTHCEVKWALGSITTNSASRGDGIPAELFQILNNDAIKVLHSTECNTRNAESHRTGKCQSERKSMPKNV